MSTLEPDGAGVVRLYLDRSCEIEKAASGYVMTDFPLGHNPEDRSASHVPDTTSSRSRSNPSPVPRKWTPIVRAELGRGYVSHVLTEGPRGP
jgi:hypothetical protein